jgi:hypothetical protein
MNFGFRSAMAVAAVRAFAAGRRTSQSDVQDDRDQHPATELVDDPTPAESVTTFAREPAKPLARAS